MIKVRISEQDLEINELKRISVTDDYVDLFSI
jgi:hypothetical protein